MWLREGRTQCAVHHMLPLLIDRLPTTGERPKWWNVLADTFFSVAKLKGNKATLGKMSSGAILSSGDPHSRASLDGTAGYWDDEETLRTGTGTACTGTGTACTDTGTACTGCRPASKETFADKSINLLLIFPRDYSLPPSDQGFFIGSLFFHPSPLQAV
jgi:hypothetical protein